MAIPKKTTYKDAINRLQEIVDMIENQELDIDLLANQIKEANELISFCSQKLNNVNEQVEKLLTENKE